MPGHLVHLFPTTLHKTVPFQPQPLTPPPSESRPSKDPCMGPILYFWLTLLERAGELEDLSSAQ